MKRRIQLQRMLRPRGKDSFVASLCLSARVFDVGCGNRSPERVKALRPDIYYVGVDVQDYEQDSRSVGMADEYRITSPSMFLSALDAEWRTMDAVISSHNLEHCEDPQAVIRSMVRALRPGGKLYLSFPCEASVTFPSRRGSLCFTDDPSHRQPPRWSEVMSQLQGADVTMLFAARRYRPVIPVILGAVLEPVSFAASRVMPLGSTWALWGFESVIWAQKN